MSTLLQPVTFKTVITTLMILTTVLHSTIGQTEEQPQPIQSCGNSPEAMALANLIRNHPRQQRKNLVCNNKLAQIARIKAKLIIDGQNIWHNAGHLTPNQLLRHHGYHLPASYPWFGNQVEALAGGKHQADDVLTDFLDSFSHRTLLLGEDPFFVAQQQLGVAYVHHPDSSYEHYWVVIIADEQDQTRTPPTNTIQKKNKPSAQLKRDQINEKLYRRKVRSTLWHR